MDEATFHCIGMTCGEAQPRVWVHCNGLQDDDGNVVEALVPLCREHYDLLMGPVGGSV